MWRVKQLCGGRFAFCGRKARCPHGTPSPSRVGFGSQRVVSPKLQRLLSPIFPPFTISRRSRPLTALRSPHKSPWAPLLHSSHSKTAICSTSGDWWGWLSSGGAIGLRSSAEGARPLTAQWPSITGGWVHTDGRLFRTAAPSARVTGCLSNAQQQRRRQQSVLFRAGLRAFKQASQQERDKWDASEEGGGEWRLSSAASDGATQRESLSCWCLYRHACSLLHLYGAEGGDGIKTSKRIQNLEKWTCTTAFCLLDCHRLKEMHNALQDGFSAQPWSK